MSKKYFPNLDGLRGYAALAVLLYHLQHPLFSYGWIGVPAFFILSGYLITNILLDTKKANNYFKAFYIRRALRIFPIYLLTFILVVLYGYLNQEHINDWFYYILYIQNYKLAWHNWNIDFPSFFNHTWSLAVEEQYYLLFPLVVFFLKPANLVRIVIFIIVISIVTRLFLAFSLYGDSISWADTICNLDKLCAGAFLAIMSKKFSFKIIFRFLITVSTLLSLLYFLFSRILNYPTFLEVDVNHYSIISRELFLILIIPYLILLIAYLSFDHKSLVTKKIFANKIVLYLGKISYGIYLYHPLIYKLIDNCYDWYLPPNLQQLKLLILFKIAAQMLLTIILAIISFNFFEKHFIDYKKHFNYNYKSIKT